MESGTYLSPGCGGLCQAGYSPLDIYSPSLLMFIIQFRRANQSANGDSCCCSGLQYYYRWEDHSSCARPSVSVRWWRQPSSSWSRCPLSISWPPSSMTPQSSPMRTLRMPSHSSKTVLNVSRLDYLWYGTMSDKWTRATSYFSLQYFQAWERWESCLRSHYSLITTNYVIKLLRPNINQVFKYHNKPWPHLSEWSTGS